MKKCRFVRRILETKLLARPKHLDDAIAPLRTINYLMGLRVFEYPRGKPRYILSLAYVLTLVGLYWSTLYEMQNYYANAKFLKLEYVLYGLMTYLNVFVVTYEMLIGWFHTKKLNACCARIVVVDETLRRLGLTIDYGGIYYVTIGMIIIWSFFIAFMTSLHLIVMRVHVNTRTAIFLTVWYVYGTSVSSVVIFEFCMSVRGLQNRFELLNELLSEGVAMRGKKSVNPVEQNGRIANAERRKGCPSTTSPLTYWSRPSQFRIRDSPLPEMQEPVRSWYQSHASSQPRTEQFRAELQSQPRAQIGCATTECRRRKHLLQMVKQLHLELCKITKILCTGFSIRLALELGLSVMFVTGILYNLYVRLILRQSILNNLMEQTLMATTLGILHVLRVVILNHLCRKAANEGNRTNEIIHAIYECDADVEIREEIQQFALQLVQSPVRFFAFGASLNYHILGSCLKAVTTHLVIMIQMSNSLESKSKAIGETRSD